MHVKVSNFGGVKYKFLYLRYEFFLLSVKKKVPAKVIFAATLRKLFL